LIISKNPKSPGGTAVEDADVVEAEKTPFEQVPAVTVFAVDSPAEVRGELAEDPPEELKVGLAS
jgi:hypothetical protein